MIGRLWKWIASEAGDAWVNRDAIAIWPWPAVIVGSAHTKMQWSDYHRFIKHLKPGDIIITRSAPFFASNAAISGSFKHAAVYVGAVTGEINRKQHFIENPMSLGVHYQPTRKPERGVFESCICHAISEGVVCQDIGDLLFHADYAMAVRPSNSIRAQSIIVSTAVRNVGKPYDFNFDQHDHKSIFCTELAALCVQTAEIDLPQKIKQRVSLFSAPVEVTLADCLSYYHQVCCSASCLEDEFISQNCVEKLWPGHMESAVKIAWERSQ